jgi:hypothetical protein
MTQAEVRVGPTFGRRVLYVATDRPTVQFTTERTYTVSRPEITLFKNVAYLDVEKLSQGEHTIELGTYKGCDTPITATVRDGMVTGFDVACDGSIEMPPAIAAKLESASKELGGGEWHDIPIGEIVNSARNRHRHLPGRQRMLRNLHRRRSRRPQCLVDVLPRARWLLHRAL